MSTSATHPSEGTERSLVVLKSPAYGPPGRSILPYRIDHLRAHGWDLRWTDANLNGALGWVAARTEPYTVPWVQALVTCRQRRDATATLAMFESEAHGLALWRLLTRRRRPPLVVVSCWLADLARAGGSRRGMYRRLYRSVDAVVVFSSNQVDTLVDLLDIPRDRIHVVPFGVDLDELARVRSTESGTVAAIGRDLGRDWHTLVAAVNGTGWRVDLLTRYQQVADLDLPSEVTFRGPTDRAGYLETLARASVVALPSEIREYPTGQTVLLEAMALGKACVTTDTPAMREYVRSGVDGVLVPPGDPVAFRDAVSGLLVDDVRRHALGSSARMRSDASGGAAVMWASIAEVLEGVTAG